MITIQIAASSIRAPMSCAREKRINHPFGTQLNDSASSSYSEDCRHAYSKARKVWRRDFIFIQQADNLIQVPAN